MIGVPDRDPRVQMRGLAERGAWFGSLCFFGGALVGVPVGALAPNLLTVFGVLAFCAAAVWWVAGETPPTVERETFVPVAQLSLSAVADDALAAEVAARLNSPSFRAAADRYRARRVA